MPNRIDYLAVGGDPVRAEMIRGTPTEGASLGSLAGAAPLPDGWIRLPPTILIVGVEDGEDA